MMRPVPLLLCLAFSPLCNALTPTIATSRASLFPSRKGLTARGGSTSNDSTTPSTSREKAIVIGGGPSGLATALTLATLPNKPYDVVLFESTAGSTASSKYDVSKAYLYNVNIRGQTLTKMFPKMQQKLNERGVAANGGAASSKIQYVPADPSEALPAPKLVSGSITMSKNATDGEAAKGLVHNDDGGEDAAYWIPRHEMVQLMKEVIEERNMEQRKGALGDEGKIKLVGGKECISVVPTSATGEQNEYEQVSVTVRDSTTGKEEQHSAKLVVGADGINSNVRRSIETMIDNYQVWPGTKNSKFRIKKYVSPATGLRLKALQLPPKFPIPNSDGTHIETSSQNIYVFISTKKGPKDFIRFGLLPMKDNESARPCNVITRPSHDIWKLKQDGESYKRWFQEAFPRLPIEKTDKYEALFSDEEWDRFAKAEGTTFPPCQHSLGLAACSPQGRAGVVLVGDACHAFSPDIGQGVNAGLTDVVALGRALRGVDVLTGKEDTKEGQGSNIDDIPSVGDALKKYEHVRSPEIKALIRLARFGAPYQYRQPLLRDRIGKTLWTANVFLRLILNKLTLGIIPKPCIMQAADPKLTYRKVMRQADTTTVGLVGALLVGLWYTVLRKFVNIPFLT